MCAAEKVMLIFVELGNTHLRHSKYIFNNLVTYVLCLFLVSLLLPPYTQNGVPYSCTLKGHVSSRETVQVRLSTCGPWNTIVITS